MSCLGGIFANQRGFVFPVAQFDERFLVLLALRCRAGRSWFWRKRAPSPHDEEKGQQARCLPMLAIVVIPVTLAYLLSGTQVDFRRPGAAGASTIQGGFTVPSGIDRVGVGAGGLYCRVYRRDRSRRHPGRELRTDRSRRFAWPQG